MDSNQNQEQTQVGADVNNQISIEQATKMLQEAGYVTAKNEDFQSLIDEKHKEATRSILSNVDSVFTEFGIEKPQDKKTTDFLKSYLEGALKTQDQLRQEVEKYKNAPDISEQIRKELQEKEQMYTSKMTEYEKKLQERESQFVQFQRKAELEANLNNIRFREDMPKSIVEAMRKIAIDELLNSPTEIRDGKLLYLDSEGKGLRNAKTFEPLTSAELLKEKLKDIIEVNRDVKSLNLEVQDKPQVVDGVIRVPKNIATRQQLAQWLTDNKVSSKEFTKTMLENSYLPMS